MSLRIDRSTANILIGPETLPDPIVVAGLEANKLPSDPLCLMIQIEVSFLHVGIEEDGEKICGFVVWHSDNAQEARVQ